MASIELVVVDGIYLCLVPRTNGDSLYLNPRIIPAIPIRSIPLYIYHSAFLSSASSDRKYSQEYERVSRKRQRDEGKSEPSTFVDKIVELKLQQNSTVGDGKQPPKPNVPTHSIQTVCANKDTSLDMPNGENLVVTSMKNGNLILTVHRRYKNLKSPSSLQVSGNSRGTGYWVADFCGVGGYQQILIFPDFSGVIVGGKSWDLDLAKKALSSILAGSILTDGIRVWLPKKGQVKFGCITSFTAPIVSPDDVYNDHNTQSKDLSHYKSSIFDARHRKPSPHWSNAVEKVLVSKLWRERSMHDKQRQVRKLQKQILQKSRNAIQDVIGKPGLVLRDIQVLRIRYRSQPVPPSSHDMRGMCVRVYTEFDIVFRSASCNQDKSDIIQDFRLSFVPSCSNVAVLRSESGIVPVLSRGDCATIISIISLEGCSTTSKCPKQSEGCLQVSVQAIWNQRTFQTSGANSKNKKGALLGVLGLPLDSVFLSESPANKFHEIDFSVPEVGNITATAVYECRKPYDLIINIAKARSDWVEVMKSINLRLEETWNRIDWQHDGKSSTVNVTIFSCSFYGISGLLHMLQSYFPETKIVRS